LCRGGEAQAENDDGQQASDKADGGHGSPP
jgi:hypothetical protein